MDLDLLERRVEALEAQILPPKHTKKEEDRITDLLIQTQTMTSSALSCRDSINSILKRMHTINEYLDPEYLDNELDVENKRQFILELYPHIKDIMQKVATLQRLVSFIDSPNIKKLVDSAAKIEELTVVNVEIYENGRDTTDKVMRLLQEYQDLMTSLKILFSQFEAVTNELEEASKPKIPQD